jgi:uncharacterized Tic20 family protein
MSDATRLTDPRDRLLAALAHAAGLLPGVGLVVPLVLWCRERERSAAVELHALQALAFQVFQTAWWGLPPLLALAVGLVVYATGQPKAINALTVVLPVLLLAGGAAFGAVCLIAALSVLVGFNFRYLLVGNLVHRALTAPSAGGAEETPGERVMAALCHAAVAHPLGFVVSFGVWSSQGRRSSFLRVQALQAALFQMLLWGLAVAAALLAAAPWFLLALAAGRQEAAGLGILAFAEGLIVILGLPLLVLVFLSLVLLGFVGGLRILRGRRFRYPLLGRLVER